MNRRDSVQRLRDGEGYRGRLRNRGRVGFWAERGVLTLLLIVAVSCAALLIRKHRSRRAEIAGATWTEVLRCDFSKDWCPAGWGWGEWTLADGYLTGRASPGNLAVYFFGEKASSRHGAWNVRDWVVPGARALGRSKEPTVDFLHAGDFVLEMRVRLVEGVAAHDAEVQLLIRDSNRVDDETGVMLRAEQTTARVRYRVGANEHIYYDVPLGQPTHYGRWYTIQFVARDGHIQTVVDGVTAYNSRFDVSARQLDFTPALRPQHRVSDSSDAARDGPLPAGTFVEPHIAVNNGVAQFERVRLYVLDDRLNVSSGAPEDEVDS